MSMLEHALQYVLYGVVGVTIFLLLVYVAGAIGFFALRSYAPLPLITTKEGVVQLHGKVMEVRSIPTALLKEVWIEPITPPEHPHALHTGLLALPSKHWAGVHFRPWKQIPEPGSIVRLHGKIVHYHMIGNLLWWVKSWEEVPAEIIMLRAA